MKWNCLTEREEQGWGLTPSIASKTFQGKSNYKLMQNFIKNSCIETIHINPKQSSRYELPKNHENIGATSLKMSKRKKKR